MGCVLSVNRMSQFRNKLPKNTYSIYDGFQRVGYVDLDTFRIYMRGGNRGFELLNCENGESYILIDDDEYASISNDLTLTLYSCSKTHSTTFKYVPCFSSYKNVDTKHLHFMDFYALR